MKKLLTIALCAALLCSFSLVSCKKDAKSTDAKDTETAASADTADTSADTTAEPGDTENTDDTEKPDDTANPDDTKKTDDTEETDTKADDTTEKPLKIEIKSEDDLEKINQMLDYDIDHKDLTEVKAGKGGDVRGIWLSSILKYEADLDNNPETVEYMNYRIAFSFRSDGTGEICNYLGPTMIPFSYTEKDGNLKITGKNLNLGDVDFTVSEDGQYMVFDSEFLSCSFMKIG